MICFNCKKQIPDNVPNCPNCGAPIVAPVQVEKEIKFRRWQRWFFYGVIIVLVLGETAYAVSVYSYNAKLLSTSVEMQKSLSQVQGELDSAKQGLNAKDAQLTQAQAQAKELQQNLDGKALELQRISSQKDDSLRSYQQLQATLSAINASTFNSILQSGVAMSNKDLAKIPVADTNYSGQDTDGDGLPDEIEEAFGTDRNKSDTDGDGYKDKQEITNGYNPLNKDKLPIDLKLANANKGKILLQMEGKGEAWYVNPKDGKRYFLGRPSEAVKTLEGLQKANNPVPAAVPASQSGVNAAQSPVVPANNASTTVKKQQTVEIPLD